MILLALDTTTPNGSIAVLDGARVLAETGVESATTHSSRLLGSIHHLLAALGLDIREIDAYAVTPGPGSFTGLRIGLSTVKSFAFASGKPIAPVSSLLALAWKLRDSGVRLVAPVIDAKKGEIYAALFESRGADLAEVVPQGAYAPGRFLSLLSRRRAIAFIGNGLGLCSDQIQSKFGGDAKFPSRSLFIAAEVGQLGYGIIKAGRGISPDRLAPLYFRASQAEERGGAQRR